MHNNNKNNNNINVSAFNVMSGDADSTHSYTHIHAHSFNALVSAMKNWSRINEKKTTNSKEAAPQNEQCNAKQSGDDYFDGQLGLDFAFFGCVTRHRSRETDAAVTDFGVHTE